MNGGQPDDDSLGGLVFQLADDARSYAKAEVAYYREVLLCRIRDAKLGVGLALGAALFAHAAVVALVIGAVMILAPRIGPGLATLSVVLVSTALAIVLGRFALKQLARLLDPVK